MKLKKIIRLFEEGNVCVVGERGKGKDMLVANVVCRRNKPYISNCPYPFKNGNNDKFIPFNVIDFNCGGNTYKDFLTGNVKRYIYPYSMGCDIYITDVGVYMPSQYCNELNKFAPELPVFFALSRQLGQCNVHTTCQNLGRIWDKLREQSRTYITCTGCKVLKLGKIEVVFQTVRLYEKYQSCLDNVPPLKLPYRMLHGADKKMSFLYKLNYDISHGKIEKGILVYINKSSYKTDIFKEMLENGKKVNI